MRARRPTKFQRMVLEEADRQNAEEREHRRKELSYRWDRSCLLRTARLMRDKHERPDIADALDAIVKELYPAHDLDYILSKIPKETLEKWIQILRPEPTPYADAED